LHRVVGGGMYLEKWREKYRMPIHMPMEWKEEHGTVYHTEKYREENQGTRHRKNNQRGQSH